MDLLPDGAAEPVIYAKNQKELAAALGVSAVWVTKLKTAGRITPEADGTWCTETVRQQIARTADLGQGVAAETRAQARAGVADALAPPDLPPVDAPLSADEGDFDQYYSADHRENFKIAQSLEKREDAAKARISRMQTAGLLVEKADVERAAYTEARVLRDRLMGLPTKIAPLLAPVADPFELERMLREALRQVLADCVRAVSGAAD